MDEKTFKKRRSSSSNDVFEFYDEYAETWDTRFGKTESVVEFHKKRLKNFLELAELSKDEVAAELGVGTGPYVQDIAPLVKKLICVDGSRGMLDVLKSKVKNLDNVVLQQIDLSKPIKKTDIKADVLFFFGLIEHIIDMDTLIENCKLMLNEGARVIAISSNAASPWYYGVRKLARAGSHLTTDKYYSRRTLGKVMREHGFEEVDYRYWGFYPAGIEGIGYQFLRWLGDILEHSPLKILAGGMTIRYRLK
jgi:SAM-dependent methyltransferase